MSIRGSLDVITTTGLAGWAYSPDMPDGLTVQALLNHQLIGEAVANLYRADLAQAGIGDGRCGYEIRFHQDVDPAYLPFISVKPDGGDVELPRMTLSGYGEYFQTVFRKFPVTGRHRSVLGGLWTDRLDAAALLRGRRELGLIGPEPAEPIEALIHAGLTLLPARSTPAEAKSAFREGEPARVAAQRALNEDFVREVLQLVLEDRPVVLRPHLVEYEEEPFSQASGAEALVSPAECLGLVIGADHVPVELEVVRQSHLLPEFTSGGASRWTSRTGAEALALAQDHGLVDRYVLEPDSVAILSPGLLHRVLSPTRAAVRAVALPARAAPLALRLKGMREYVCAGGTRIWA